jgi:DNA polymerase III delta subunit
MPSRVREETEKEVVSFLGSQDRNALSLERYSISPADPKEEASAVLSKVRESLSTRSFFSPKKVVRLDLKDSLEAGRSKARARDLREEVSEMIKGASDDPDTLFILISEVKWSVPAEDVTVKEFFQSQGVRPLKVRVHEKIRSAGKRIQDKDLEEWISAHEEEDDLWDQLEQVFLRTGKRKEIVRSDIDSFLTIEIDKGAFAFSNALGRQDLPKLIQLLDQSIELEGEAPQIFLAKVISHLMQLEAVQGLLKRHPLQKEKFRRDRNGFLELPDPLIEKYRSIARTGIEEKIVSRHPYALRALFSTALEYGEGELERWSEELCRVDEAVKSLPVEPKYLIEISLIRILGKCRTEAAA